MSAYWTRPLSGAGDFVNRLLCVGPVYLDVNCLRFPCEDGLRPEQEALGGHYELVPGGSAANFARFGHALGLDTALLGKTGTDPLSAVLASMLAADGVRVALVADPRVVTDLGINLVAPSGAAVMALAGTPSARLGPDDLPDIGAGGLGDVSHVYLGGSFKLPHLLPHLSAVVKRAQARGVTVILDHGRVPPSPSDRVLRQVRALARAVDVYMPSRGEFLKLWDAADLDEAADAYRAKSPGHRQTLVVKDGARGAVAYREGERYPAAGYPVEVRNTVGAGDCFNAGFWAATTRGSDLPASLDFACAAAAVKVSQPGLPTRRDVERLRRRRPAGSG